MPGSIAFSRTSLLLVEVALRGSADLVLHADWRRGLCFARSRATVGGAGACQVCDEMSAPSDALDFA
jgi:hypothetical protein